MEGDPLLQKDPQPDAEKERPAHSCTETGLGEQEVFIHGVSLVHPHRMKNNPLVMWNISREQQMRREMD